MINEDEIIYNDLDHELNDMYASDYLYFHYYPLLSAEYEEVNVFKIVDIYSSGVCKGFPVILIDYHYNNKHYKVYVWFTWQNHIRKYLGYKVIINDTIFCEIENSNVSLSYFLNLDQNEKILSFSEEKCIKKIEKIERLAPFL